MPDTRLRSRRRKSAASTFRCCDLLHRHAFRQIPRLIDVASAAQGDVVGEQLRRDDGEDRLERLDPPWAVDYVVRGRFCRRVAFPAADDELPLSRLLRL